MATQAPETLNVPWSRISPQCRLRIPRAGRAGDPGPCPAPSRLEQPDGQPAHHLDGPRNCALGDRPTGRNLGVAGTCLVGLAKPGEGRRVSHLAVAWVWGWAGTVLGMLLLIGPLLATRTLHPAASGRLGAGPRFSTPALDGSPDSRLASPLLLGRGIVILAMPACLLAQWNAVVRTPEPTWSRPVAGSANLLWIVVDTLRADHMSMYGYGRETTPELAAWAKEGITFETRARPRPGHYLRT